MRGRAVYKYHNSVLLNYGVIAMYDIVSMDYIFGLVNYQEFMLFIFFQCKKRLTVCHALP